MVLTYASRLLVAFTVLIGAFAASAAHAETRTLKMHFTHTKETVNVTFKRNGRYVKSGLRKINRFLRDWRRNEPTRMDPELLDIVWEIYKETGSRKPIHVISGYRSSKTNAALRRRGRKVARKSQHMRGRALDWFIPGYPVHKLHAIAMRRHGGGVGHYRGSFIHTDTGSVRHWPKMSRRQLAKIFPRGRTIHIPRGGKRMKGYSIAAANIKKGLRYDGRKPRYRSGGSAPTLLARLFRRDADDADDVAEAKPQRARKPKPAAAKPEPVKPAPAEPTVVADAEPELTPAQQKEQAAQLALAAARAATPIAPTLRRRPEAPVAPQPEPSLTPEPTPVPAAEPGLAIAQATRPSLRPRAPIGTGDLAETAATVAYAAPAATTSLLRPPADIPGVAPSAKQAPVEVAAIDPAAGGARDPQAEIDALNARIRSTLSRQRIETTQARERARRENEALKARLASVAAPKRRSFELAAPQAPAMLATAAIAPAPAKPAARWVPGRVAVPATATAKVPAKADASQLQVAALSPLATEPRPAVAAKARFVVVAEDAPSAAMRLANLHGRSVKQWAVAPTTRVGPVATMRMPRFERAVHMPAPATVLTQGFERKRRLRTDSFTGTASAKASIAPLEQVAMR